MEARKLLDKEGFDYDHFTRLTSTGIEADYNTIAQFAEKYHQEQVNIMPCSLTAENGAKSLLIGEFFYENEYEDEDGEYQTQKIPLEWTTIKDIYKKIVDHYKA